jgi:hypothetical protein
MFTERWSVSVPSTRRGFGGTRRVGRGTTTLAYRLFLAWLAFAIEGGKSWMPTISKAEIMALAAGDSWVDNIANLPLFVPPLSAEVTLRRLHDWQSAPFTFADQSLMHHG